MRWITFLFLFSLTVLAQAQNARNGFSGARSSAMGNAAVAVSDIESAYYNQAGLAFLEGFAFNLSAQNKFALAELNHFNFAAALPTRSGVFALDIAYFGFEDYNEQKIGLAYARKLLTDLSISVQFDYLNTRISEYGDKGVFSFELGLLSKLFKKLSFAAHAFSPVRISINDQEELPIIFKTGLAYQPSDKVVISTEVEKDLEFPLRFKMGIQYQLASPLHIRLGISTHPVQLSFGMGYRFQNMRIDASSSYHQVLGVSPAASISYFQNKAKS